MSWVGPRPGGINVVRNNSLAHDWLRCPSDGSPDLFRRALNSLNTADLTEFIRQSVPVFGVFGPFA